MAQQLIHLRNASGQFLNTGLFSNQCPCYSIMANCFLIYKFQAHVFPFAGYLPSHILLPHVDTLCSCGDLLGSAASMNTETQKAKSQNLTDPPPPSINSKTYNKVCIN